MSFKTELHCHTNFSGCSNVSAADMVDKFEAAGYSTVVVTNHFNYGYMNREGDYRTLVKNAFAAIEEARAAAEGRMNILAGMELSLKCMLNDFLLYGVTEEFFLDVGEELFDMRPWQVRDKIHEVGGVIIQAHPFRFGQVVVNPAEVDGIEVFNGHSGQYSHNEIAKAWALAWADKYKKGERFILTSGSDHHDDCHRATGGIITEEEIRTSDELLAVLKSGNYERITSYLGRVEF